MALVDDVRIKIAAGNGGNGGRSFHQNYGSVKSTGDGGNGGRGGNIYFEGTSNLNDLSDFRFKKRIQAPDGKRGMNHNLDGKKGEDVTILVPLGTTVIDTATGETIEILEGKIPQLFAKGGRGQTGNHDSRGPLLNESGMPQNQKGERKEVHLILNMVADIGLIGLPNAGKSSLLKTLTNALPKIGNYAFTTLEPNLGTISTTPGEKNIVIADIPGLVEGASVGRGLGIQFLKHIQKTKMLVHCIDATQSNPYETYLTVIQEFDKYDSTLLDKNEIILLTKIDLVEPEIVKKQLTALKKTKKKILTTSIYDEISIELLKKTILKLINE